MSRGEKKKDHNKILVSNRRARHDYQIHETLEAGLVLVGSEVKSLRDAKATISDGHIEIRDDEAWLLNVQINEYPWANKWNHEPKRKRKLLLKKREIQRIAVRTQQRGYTAVPLSLYLKNGKIKLELGLATGKRQYDKRQHQRAHDAKRDIDRALKYRK